jgi:amino acid adenylation domain-containing protein
MDNDSATSTSRLDLQAAKRELLARLLKKEGIDLHDSHKIYPGQGDNNNPLSFTQERLWFLDQLEPGNSVYNIGRAQRLVGPLDLVILTQSINEIVRRHEILRTTFACVDGVPSQVAAPTFALAVPVVNLRDLPPSAQKGEISRIAVEEAQFRFNLAMGPLLRAKLLQLGGERHVLLLTTHQIVCDGWSIGVFFRELSNLYQSYSSGNSSMLEDLPIQYADFAAWQRQWLQGEVLETQISYWQKQLGDSLPILGISTDRPRPAVQRFRGAREPVLLSKDLAKGVRIFSQRAGVTSFMILLAVFKTLLYRYTGQENLLVGCPFAGRDHLETENLIGSFVNTLVLRTNLNGDLPFSELLSRVRDTCLGAFAHQDLPFEKLVMTFEGKRDLSRNPLFQAMFAFQNRSVASLNLPALTSEPIEVDTKTSKFDFTLSLTDRGNDLAGFFEYNTDLFNRSTIERMIGYFRMLLEGILADSNKPISTLTLLTEEEHHQLVVKWNETEADYPKYSCIHELFEVQVERTSSAVAVQFEGKWLTYRELNTRANQLAHYLRRLGVGPEKLVGICVERSTEMVVGLLGILKAGGAYVPLDPSYPEERLKFMLEDSQVGVLLTQAQVIEDRGWRMEDGDSRSSVLDPQLKVVRLDRDATEIEQQSTYNLNIRIGSEHLAYVIYTSGSTGQPKGVQVSHRSIVNCLQAIARQLGFTKRDILLGVTTISFDIAGLEIYLPILLGGKLVLASREDTIDGRELLGRLAESSATAMQATPSTWRMLLDAGWKGARDFKILCGGETLSRDLANRLLGCGTLWNLYGPTESTIWSTIQKVEPGEGSVPIGRPIANTQIYILDSHHQPVPIGISGDLYIGGDGLARGYLNRPELTLEKFIPNTFNDNLNSRLYRTGDRVKYLADGTIEFLGRMDNQVKLRGHRIELGEIEATLIQHPAVKDSVVVVSAGDSLADQSLIAYVVAKQQMAPSVAELRAYLKERLPDYMIPSLFVILDALPLTPNGKIDRNGLRPPDRSRSELAKAFVEPHSDLEELVAQVWREVLKLDEIGIHDNFFELGGHSLLATRVVARLRANFNIDLPLRKLFELPTVARLAGHIETLRRHERGVRVPPVLPVPRNRPIPLSFSQRRLWFLEKLDPGLVGYNMPATFEIKGVLDVSVLERALNDIIARHESLRTRIVEVDGHPYQEVVAALNFALPVIELTYLSQPLASIEVERIAAEDARAPFNLGAAPLMRAKILRLSENHHVFILNFHHIVSDGSSVVVLFEELALLYGSFLEGKPSPLAPLAVQFADYSFWQNEILQSPEISLQLQYWRNQLRMCQPLLNLPTDYRRTSVTSYLGAKQSVVLSDELTKRLREMSLQEGATMFMILLAGFYLLLSRHSGQRDLIVGATVAGRNHPEIERLIGFFINVLPFRVEIPADITFQKFVQQVRETCLDAYTHQDLPFERIVEEIKPERELGRQPLVQVLFNLADIAERFLILPGCEVVKLASFALAAKYELALSAPEIDGKIQLNIVYNTELFCESRIVSMLRELEFLLSQVAANPTERVDRLSLLAPFSQSMLPDPRSALGDAWHGPIYDKVASHGISAPNQLAVIDMIGHWSYREIDNCSLRFVADLMDREIQAGDLVVVYAHRSGPLVPILLGILRAGAVFVILDPAYPPARLIDLLRIARPKGWIQMAAAGKLSAEVADYLPTLDLRCQWVVPSSKDDLSELLLATPIPQAVSVSADAPAYVAFTSGTTGQPKGVLCRHGSMTHFLPWQEKKFDLGPTDRFCVLSGLAYNYLQREIFTALWVGATVYMPPPEILQSPNALLDWLQQNEITILHLTPALGQFLGMSTTARLLSVRRIFCGGDVLTKHTLATLRKFAPNAKITNLYGATETQRASGYFEVPESMLSENSNVKEIVPLGRGVEDVQLLLLTLSGKLAGIGEIGELFVRSPHLAAGYINDEQLTRERFLVNPFATTETDRMFRTGEIGRYMPDGDVERVGRNDRRVNIRGFRVELEEIEVILKQHPTVIDVAVMMHGFGTSAPGKQGSEASDPKLDHQLVAYIVSNEEDSQSLRDLLYSYISARLPGHMVPLRFVVLQRLPLNPNGKVDYRALSEIQLVQTEPSIASIAPRNAVEAQLCNILAQVLGQTTIGMDDNFFRLGGHSLLAVQAVVRIQESFGITIDLRLFLDAPTIARLAQEIEVRLRAKSAALNEEDIEREEIEL